MKFNPEKLVWKAPTTNVDGTPIDYELDYELGVAGTDGTFAPVLVVPAQLQGDGYYNAPIAEMPFEKGGVYTVAMRSFAKDDRTRMSAWSNPVEFAISDRVPSAPLELRAI